MEYQYAEEVSSELKCAICIDPFVEPMELPCGHVFCHKCVLPISKCPECRGDFSHSQVKPVNRIITSMLNNLKVQCDNKGCKELVNREFFAQHKEKECKFKHCTFSPFGCHFQGDDREVAMHLDNNCPYNKVKEVLFRLQKENEHLKEENRELKEETKELTEKLRKAAPPPSGRPPASLIARGSIDPEAPHNPRPTVSQQSLPPSQSVQVITSPGFPEGWEMRQDQRGRTYFIDHINKKSTWNDPRLASTAPSPRSQAPSKGTQAPAQTEVPMQAQAPVRIHVKRTTPLTPPPKTALGIKSKSFEEKPQ